jgi:multidrug efflux system outer membrane protein
MKFKSPLISVIIIGAATGCGILPSVGPDYEAPQMEVPSEWSSKVQGDQKFQDATQLATWWKVLGDEKLNWLIEQSLDANRQLEIVKSRVREVKENRASALGSFFPQVGTGAGFSRTRISSRSVQGNLFGSGAVRGVSLVQNNWDASFDVSWEIDVLGGLRRSYEAADASVQSTEEQLNDTYVSLVSEVARTYFEVRSLEKRVSIAKENIDIQTESRDIVKSRVDAGLSSELDLAQADTQLENTKAAWPALISMEVNARSRLAVLTGRTIQEIDNSVPKETVGKDTRITMELPTGILQGVPSEILRNRPDIRVAERNLAAQTALIGVAKSDLFPKFTLTGNGGLQSLTSQNFLDASAKKWSIGPSVSVPIFTAGKLLAQLRAQNERAEQAASQYEQIVLSALAEGESSLVAYEQEKLRFDTLKRAYDASLQSLALSKELYQKGLADFLRVIEAQRSAFIAQDVLAQSEQELVSSFISSYKALGYGWQAMEEVPEEKS